MPFQILSRTLLIISRLLFAVITYFAWQGKIGLPVLGLLLLSFVCFIFGKRGLEKAEQQIASQWAKALFTIIGVLALLRHPIPCPPNAGSSCVPLPVYTTISTYIEQVDSTTFLTFALIAMLIKFVGVLSSAFAWHLLLIGQGIRYPYWQMIVTSFLIGRFIGTFLPSTIGLDGYTAYEAGRYSNQWSRVFTAKILEKFIGITGLFLGMLLTLPFGYAVIVDVTEGKPEAAPIIAGVIILIAGGVSAVVLLGLSKPKLLLWLFEIFQRFLPKKITNQLTNFTDAVAAYQGKTNLLLLALFNKFITHFTTATVYFFTALAIGVTSAQFWPIVFGSNIQILGTIFSPTIAGEGAREALQALLLEKQLGGVAQAVLSGALGFIAAEAATMWGGAFIWTRKPEWRPSFTLVDDQQVDYNWVDSVETFSADTLAELKQSSKA
jgi:hypothetical protein